VKKEIREVKNGVLQITTLTERWYARQTTDKAGLPVYEYVPSVTWIADYYPKGIGFYKWLANQGWDEAEALKQAAADKGSKVHQAILKLIDGETIKISDKFINNSTEQEEELTLEEWECLMSFADWYKKAKPQIINREFVVWSDEYKYAGTIDLLCTIGEDTYIIDFKTGQHIWPSYEIQLSAYKYASKVNGKLAILQLGYQHNKNRYKFTEIEDQFELFLSAKKIWEKENKDTKPQQKDYPLEIAL